MPIESGDSSTQFNKQFQYGLLAHLWKCPAFMDEVVGVLDLTDFDLDIARVVWEALKDFHLTHRTTPGPDTLALHVSLVLSNPEGTFKSYAPPEQLEALWSLLQYMMATPGDNPEYFKAQLPRYIKWIRTSRLLAEHNDSMLRGQDPSRMLTSLAAVNEGVSLIDASSLFHAPESSLGSVFCSDATDFITTGCDRIDVLLNGGATRGELGMLMGNPGFGKTNTLMNFCIAPAMLGKYTLFISLELIKRVILQRYCAMVACIEALTFRKKIDQWSDIEVRRLATAIHPASKLAGHFLVAERAMQVTDTAAIEGIIKEWKRQIKKQTGSDEDCVTVCLDWMQYIQPSEDVRDEWKAVVQVGTELKRIANRQNVNIWTAQQTTKDADGKAVMRMKDTAFGYHANDATDISIGLGTSEGDRLTAADLQNSANGQVLGKTDKRVVISVTKRRNGTAGICEIYMAPTLRFYNTDADYRASLKAIDYGIANDMSRQFVEQASRQLVATAPEPVADAQFDMELNTTN